MFCPKCGKENPDDNKFCKECGDDLKSNLAKPIKSYFWVNFFIFLIIIAIVIAFVMGMLGTGILGKPSINIGEIHGNTEFDSLKIQFQIYNTGNAVANNVYANVELVSDSQTNIISKRVFVGNLAPGESKIITTDFSGTFPTYTKFRVRPQYNQ